MSQTNECPLLGWVGGNLFHQPYAQEATEADCLAGEALKFEVLESEWAFPI